jgi:hypothetical protein
MKHIPVVLRQRLMLQFAAQIKVDMDQWYYKQLYPNSFYNLPCLTSVPY